MKKREGRTRVRIQWEKAQDRPSRTRRLSVEKENKNEISFAPSRGVDSGEKRNLGCVGVKLLKKLSRARDF